MTRKISSRDWAVSDLIRARQPFETYGALRAEERTSLGAWDSGILSGYDLEVFRRDRASIRYVVYSYSTPIAWWASDTDDKNMPRAGHWHKVRQSFSVTTSRHQGKIPNECGGSRWEPWFDASLRDDLACRRERGQHVGPVGYTDDGTLCQRHYEMRPAVKHMVEAQVARLVETGVWSR